MPRLASARSMDSADPLRPFRSRFLDPGPQVLAYLDGNSLGRPLAETGAHLWSFVCRDWGDRLIRSWDEGWMDLPFALGDRLGAACLGAAAGQCVIADSTSVLLYKVLRAALAAQPGRDEIIMSANDFPTDRYLAEAVAAETGSRIVWLETPPEGGVGVEQVEAALNQRTAVVVLSHIAYRSGFIADAPALTALAHAAGARIIWDLCHSAGVFPIALDAWDVDYAVGCTYKYLNGGPGSPALAYVAARHQDSLQQPLTGWMGAAAPFEMTAPFTPAAGMRRLLTGTPPVLAMQPLIEMAALIAEVGIEAIREKSVLLTERAIALSDAVLTPLGVRLASPRAAELRGSHVTLDHPAFQDVTARLWQRGVIPDFRPPDGIRLGLSPLTTSFAELDAGIEAIREELAGCDG